ncbi:hypothetical protein BAUCODRAFT_240311 [Baudoinia panamericana UAMH 10762]|uniref:Zn(2)-C6 fungal-type domain-containing protein n=1 Tax=Baudoinia panamericana (strain UAMH 10762) TaxID=717646 RepID=M2N378_BAUPA|nr:uncharacterized protein BAUCODRAFT_240311 [Baudoinia panamericana UAMH 10762]EMC93434.1 hypothetical protein BAUCODRAFT_240311 [Baudoinia panamericana UAMH 10762]
MSVVVEQQTGGGGVTKRVRVGERTLLACIGCKQRKLKCDGQTPKCQNCIRTDRDCLVEDPATGIHRPRNYIQSLEAHVAYLERLLQEVRPDVALDHLANVQESRHPSASPPAQPPAPLGSTLGFHKEPAEVTQAPPATGVESSVDDLSSEVALLCISAAGREPHYFGPSSALSFSRIASQTMGLRQRSASFRSSAPSSLAEPVTRPRRPSQLRFPPQETAAKLSRAYFDNIHPQYPFLHAPTFQHWEEECVAAQQNNDFTSVSQVSLFFVLMVYAIGSLAFGPGQYDAADEYYATALEHIAPVLDVDGIESIQSILCCAVYSIRSPVGASLWKVSGMAIRHCVELGYHRSAEKYRRTADPLMKEMSKRCFWVAYDIDRVAACVLGRPAGIPDHMIDAELPADIDDEHVTTSGFLERPRTAANEPLTSMSGAIHGIKLRRLWSKFSAQIYLPTAWRQHSDSMANLSVESLRKELEDWHATIPTPPHDGRPQPLSVFASREWFLLAYYHSILLLYRPYILAPASVFHDHWLQDSADGGIVERAFEECFAKARDMCLHYRRLYQSPSIQFTWGSLHILFLGGLTYLYCLWRSNSVRQNARQSDVVNTCMACSTVLIIIGERWKMATSYRDIFGVLSERTISMMCGEVPQPTGNTVARDDNLVWQAAVNEQDPMEEWLASIDGLGNPESQWMLQQLMTNEPILDSDANLRAIFPEPNDLSSRGFPASQIWQ